MCIIFFELYLQEVHNTVFMSQELAKRCIWLNRVYTPAVKTPDNPTPGETELYRRLNTLQKDLRVCCVNLPNS